MQAAMTTEPSKTETAAESQKNAMVSQKAAHFQARKQSLTRSSSSNKSLKGSTKNQELQ